MTRAEESEVRLALVPLAKASPTFQQFLSGVSPMHRLARFAVLLSLGFFAPLAGAQTFKGDPVHSFVIFRIKHLNASYSYGRFNATEGQFTLDANDPTKSSFNFTVKADSLDTGNAQRDGHLKSPDFLNTKQYPTISFKSTAAKKVADNKLEVTGDLSLHGVTKSITVPIELTGTGEMRGKVVAGIEAVFEIKRTDFDMNKMVGMVGDDVRLVVSLEGTK
jgi:polyisoprenoid-binding protein YceI